MNRENRVWNSMIWKLENLIIKKRKLKTPIYLKIGGKILSFNPLATHLIQFLYCSNIECWNQEYCWKFCHQLLFAIDNTCNILNEGYRRSTNVIQLNKMVVLCIKLRKEGKVYISLGPKPSTTIKMKNFENLP
jgi:hypothetical protein